MDYIRGIIGITVLIAILYIFSSNRKKIDWKLVGIALGVQLLLGMAILWVDEIRMGFDAVSSMFVNIIAFTDAGAEIVFGGLMNTDSVGYVFAVRVLPTIVFFSALSAILYYLGILQIIIYALAWLMSRAMRLTGAESLAAAANVFIGQTEAPLIIKPFLGQNVQIRAHVPYGRGHGNYCRRCTRLLCRLFRR